MPDSQKTFPDEDEQALLLLWLRITIVLCLFLASLSVLDSFITLFAYLAFEMGKMEPSQNREWINAFQQIQQSPFLFILMNLYNIVVWNGVIIGCIWLLRYHKWARKIVRSLLGLDMIVTVCHLLWEVGKGTATIVRPGWFITLNALQLCAIIILSHPRIIGLIDQISMQQKQAVHSFNNSNIR